MRGWRQAEAAEYHALTLEAHALLAGVPLHDVWVVELPGRDRACTVAELRGLLGAEGLAEVNAFVRFLFRLRAWLGRVFHLDGDGQRDPRTGTADSSALADLSRVPPELRARSLRTPGTRDGPFVSLYELEHEALGEIRNATVHAFSVMAVRPCEGGHRLVWAIHVAPVGAITRFYMALIDPFRRWFVYPALLGQLHRRWLRGG